MYRGWTQTDYQNKYYNKPKGRRNIVRPWKRWRDQLHLEDQGTGNTPNPSGNDDDNDDETWWYVKEPLDSKRLIHILQSCSSS